jgi:hypothetical protein
MTKKQTLKWNELKNFKKVINIEYENTILFQMTELEEKEVREILDMYNTNKTDSVDEDKEQIFDVDNSKILVFALKKVCRNIDFGFMTDSEILSELESFGESVSKQINSALRELITERIIRFGEDIKLMAEDLDKLIKNNEQIKEGTV